ncbi:hypothetical protein [Phreatobacter sp. AB_2022a]|uniref:hypothetical protein n=1 Tax=Phreatobacter sp. AB_2022a TaxID=3003134 RepID=UPI002286F8C6|nr:hypothetical protein [Phreatobacter sp. AB_2022a]MCZ0738202.1 hypothetical protein [Phreatobacter sp. AB_2022a]
MSEVISLFGDQLSLQGEPNKGLVNIIEELLAMAKDGRLQSLVATGYTLEGARLAVWADTHPNAYEMLGAITALQGEYVHRHPGLTSM